MDTQNPQNPTSEAPSPAPEPDTAPVAERREPAEPAKFEAPKGAKDTGRFAAYDTTLGKYVGGVHDTKTKATDAAKAAGAASYKVVEV